MLFANESTELRAELTTFEVIDQDVTGVTIKLSRGSVVSGIVVLESEDKAAKRLLGETMMRGYVQSAPGFGNSASSPIAADGSFRLAGLANGPVNITISGTVNPYPPKGFSISRIERDGMVTPRIEVKDGEHVTGVKVFIGYGNAVLRGVVKIENGSLPSGAYIYLRMNKQGENTSYVQPPQVDQRGFFLLEGIPPGQYELTAQIVGNVKGLKPIKQNISLTDGAVTEVTITFDFATLTNPQ
jgi:hypothetical protein